MKLKIHIFFFATLILANCCQYPDIAYNGPLGFIYCPSDPYGVEDIRKQLKLSSNQDIYEVQKVAPPHDYFRDLNCYNVRSALTQLGYTYVGIPRRSWLKKYCTFNFEKYNLPLHIEMYLKENANVTKVLLAVFTKEQNQNNKLIETQWYEI